MSSKQNEIPPPPGFPRPLIEISPTSKVGEWTSLGEMRSLRKMASQNSLGLTPSCFSPQPDDQSSRRGRARPPKQRLDESSASQPLRRGRGRPPKKRSDVPTTVIPPPMPLLGSTSDRPFLVPCDEEEEEREPKLKLTPLSRLMAEKETHTSTNASSSQMQEKSKKDFTDEVKSTLVSQLTSGTSTSVDDMVTIANRAFTTLNWFGADYGSLYKDVKDLIVYKYDLLTADRKLEMLSVSELEKKYLNAVTRGNDIRDEKYCLKDDEEKYRAAHKIAQAEVEKLSTRMKEARVMQSEIERCKNEALQGIESTTPRLLSYK